MSNRIPIGQQISKNPKVMVFGHNEEAKIVTHDGSKLEVVQDSRYLCSWIASTEADAKARKARKSGNPTCLEI